LKIFGQAMAKKDARQKNGMSFFEIHKKTFFSRSWPKLNVSRFEAATGLK
jgi:hypothetical protein